MEKGFEQSISVGTDIGLGSDKLIDVGVNYILGYRVSNGFFIGVGTGVNYVVKDDGWWKNHDFFAIGGLNNNLVARYCPAASKVMIPLYLHIRTYLSKSKCQPYFALSGGAKFGLKGKPELILESDVDGFLIHAEPYSPINYLVEPAFGLSFRGKKDKGSFFMQFGGLIQIRPYYRPVSETQGALSRKMSGGLTVKIGCTF